MKGPVQGGPGSFPLGVPRASHAPVRLTTLIMQTSVKIGEPSWHAVDSRGRAARFLLTPQLIFHSQTRPGVSKDVQLESRGQFTEHCHSRGLT